MEWQRNFSPTPESVRAARQFVRQAAAMTPADPVIAELLASELATNAVLHAQTNFEVRVSLHLGILRVEVLNDAPELVASMRDPDVNGGHGLRLINNLAADWGTASSPQRKVVWFELQAQNQN